ncbi:MAG: acetyl-CoA carboxylase carboxyltransferase subunit alpha [Acidobacteria bacterium]|nr:acetyl-CoA carboxylase carboxyltransferase subunit alpha [Acidobacteriota bacterium]MCB9396827.1 acetyl-CoA carboxylase carboxyltransferase subunit alpha [Acidobacteriota bacterium]
MSRDVSAFEEPIIQLKATIEGLKAQPPNAKTSREISKHEQRLLKLQKEIYSNLTDWQRCIVARHPNRPYTRDYLENLFTDFEELHGDRRFADDPAIMAGFGQFQGRTVCFVGHQKGRDMKAKLHRNFGMPRPEGYRKALRIMQLAEKFGRPIICMIDTPGAYPGIDAEERGQAEAIAYNLKVMAMLKVPIIVYVIGEGGSGGALAIGVGDHVCMLQNAIYSVISPEGCASILWKDAGQMEQAAEALHLTSDKLLKLGLIDSVCEEPPGGAHSDPAGMFERFRDHLSNWLQSQGTVVPQNHLTSRYQKFRNMGIFSEEG